MIEHLPFHRLTCPCGCKGMLIKHGYYTRSFKTAGKLIDIKILRVRCSSCFKTHSLLPSWIIPYSRTLLIDHLRIIKAYLNKTSFHRVMIDNLLIDESNIAYILKKYKKHWHERLQAFSISFNNHFIHRCFFHFSKHFMQIKRTSNILFNPNHIT